MFGLLEYKNSFNLGDNIQSIAAQNLLPKVDCLVDRDTGQMSKFEFANVIYNGWFDGKYAKFPLGPHINPLFISFHINETNPRYDCLDKYELEIFKPIGSNVDFFQKYEPIGCRDLYTVKTLQHFGVKAYFSGCLTLTLENEFKTKTNEILIVDVSPSNLEKIPKEKRDQAILITHTIKIQMNHNEKMKMAQDLLNRYAQAKEVYTSRLHCLLPCKAFGTLVHFLPNDPLDVRFEGLANLSMQEVKRMANHLRQQVTNWLNEIPKNDVSIFTACMNRVEHLQEVLPTWIALHPKEIIIVDWNSTKPLDDVIAPFQDKQKIILIRVPNVKKWCLTYAFNFAARFTSGKYLLKLDCDSKLNKDFLFYHNLDAGNVFFSGNWRTARNVNERHTNGVFYLKRLDFFKVGGFNEFLTTYGYDDCKLKADLVAQGIIQMDINHDLLVHIEHSNASRTMLQDVKHQPAIEIECNRLICEKIKNIPNVFSKFSWISNNNYNYESSVLLDESIRSECLRKALSRFSKVYVEVQSGLGNRLRTLSAAYNIAKGLNRELIVIWIPDFHCEAHFNDLFRSKLNVIKYVPVFTNKIDKYDNTNNVIDDDSVHDIFISCSSLVKSKHTNWTKECNFLQSLSLQENLETKLNDFSKKMNVESYIGVHIRMSQPDTKHDDLSNYDLNTKINTQKWRNASDWKVFVDEMKKILQIDPNQQFLLCCDNMEAHNEIIASMESNIIFYPEKLYDRSTKQIQIALIEVMLLSRTKFILGSNWSTFTELAKRLGNKKAKLAGIDF
jgi:Polysaccharide pyruvyl transferase/Glycosyl transferase family 2